MKSYIKIKASKDQLDKIQSHYDKVGDFLNQKPVNKKKTFLFFSKQIEIYEMKPPRGCFYCSIIDTEHPYEYKWLREFRSVFNQLKTEKEVLMDNESYDTFIALTK